MRERFIRWLGGYPRVEGVNMPPEPAKDHYVMFLVDGQAYTTENVSKQVADVLAKDLEGIVMPVDTSNS